MQPPGLSVLGPSRAQSKKHHNLPLILPPKREGSEESRVDRDLAPKFLVVPGFAPPKVGICDVKGSTFLQRLGP